MTRDEGDSTMTPNTLGALDRIVEIADQFESAWRRGLRPCIEAFLDEGPPAHRSALLYELIRIELELRRELGESPRVDEYRERFPLDREPVDAAFTNPTSESGSPR